MNVYVTLYNNRTGVTQDISEVVSNISISTYIMDTPGKCTFQVITPTIISIPHGSTISVQLDGVKMFRGFVFTTKYTKETEIVDVTAYDQLIYLGKNKDTYVFENMTSDQIFAKICDDFVLRYRVVDPSPYVCAPRNNSDTKLYDMIKYALNDTLANIQQWFMIRDNFGTLEHVNVYSLQAGVIIGDRSGLTNFTFETSIDNETYNQIKLYRDNQATGKRELFIVNDTINGGANLRNWGILQYYDKVDDNLNIAQIEQRAIGMLGLYNHATETLQLESLGVARMHAGSIFQAQIENMGDTSINSYMLVTECTHTIQNDLHTMSLKTEVVRT